MASVSCCDAFSSALNSNNGVCLCYLVRQPSILRFLVINTRVLSLSSVCPTGEDNNSSIKIGSLQSLCSGSKSQTQFLVSWSFELFLVKLRACLANKILSLNFRHSISIIYHSSLIIHHSIFHIRLPSSPNFYHSIFFTLFMDPTTVTVSEHFCFVTRGIFFFPVPRNPNQVEKKKKETQWRRLNPMKKKKKKKKT